MIAPLLKEPVDRYLLENGLTALLKPDRSSPVCSVQVWVKTGSMHEDRLLGSGISHFVEHMLFKGTEKRPGKEIARESLERLLRRRGPEDEDGLKHL